MDDDVVYVSDVRNTETFLFCCVEELVRFFEALQPRSVACADVVENFSRVNIMKAMAIGVMASAKRT